MTLCQYWFKRLKNDLDLNNKPRSRWPRKVENDLRALLDEDSAQTQQELADKLEIIQAISKRLHTIGKIQEGGKMDV